MPVAASVVADFRAPAAVLPSLGRDTLGKIAIPAVLVLCLLFMSTGATSPGPVAAVGLVEVDLEVSFLDEHATHDFDNLASGFLGDHNFANPPADRIVPLNPRHWRWWRNIERPYGYVEERFQFGLGSKWTSPFSPGFGCGHPGGSCSYPGTLREYCEAEAAASLAQGSNPRWDFWPEPGWPGVGGGHPFASAWDFAFWLRECAMGLRDAYDASVGYGREDLILVAPSLWQWPDIYRVMFVDGAAGCTVLQSPEFFGPTYDCDAGEPSPFGLLEYLDLHRDDLELDLVSAHQFYDYMTHFWPGLFKALEAALQAEIAERGLAPMRISVNEYIGPSYNLCVEPIGVPPESPECLDPIHERNNFLRPGHTVKGLATLHGGWVESAIKACWTDPTTGLSGCNEKALDGLLVGDTTMARRPVWHVYRIYGELLGHEMGQSGITSSYLENGAPFDPLGGIASRDDTLGDESYRVLVGYSNLMYQPELEIPGNDVYESFRGPYRWIDQVDVSLALTGLDPDCSSAAVFSTDVSGSDFVAPMATVTRVDLGPHPIVGGVLVVERSLGNNDAWLVELEDFGGGDGCLTDLDGDGQSDPVADPTDLIFSDGFESGDTSAWNQAGATEKLDRQV